MDIEQFIDHMDELILKAYPSTRLRTKRLNNGMSQSELARDSGVALRQIQLFEQRQRDINNASAITLLKLSRSLHCRIEDLIEL
jgi:transcriptional regulator with XRE-family HTH domain